MDVPVIMIVRPVSVNVRMSVFVTSFIQVGMLVYMIVFLFMLAHMFLIVSHAVLLFFKPNNNRKR